MSFLLSKISSSMYQELYSWRNDEYAMKHNPFAACNLAEFSDKMESYSSNLQHVYNKNSFKWVILDGSDILSLVGLCSINQMMGTAEIGYQVNPKFRKQGIGTKAVLSLVMEVFKTTKLRKLTAIISAKNIPSCKIVEKIGFKQEGLLRKHFIINGQEVDERFYGIFKDEVIDLETAGDIV